MSGGVGVQKMSPGIGTNPQEKGIVSGGNAPLRAIRYTRSAPTIVINGVMGPL